MGQVPSRYRSRVALSDQNGEETHGVHSSLRAIWLGEKLNYITRSKVILDRGLIMRVIQRGPAILGDGLLQDFSILRAADLAEATRRGYAADLGRFRAWIEAQRLGSLPTADRRCRSGQLPPAPRPR